MGQGKAGRDEGGSVFVLLCILVLIVGIVAAAGMVMAVLNYTRESDTPININVEGSDSRSGEEGHANGNSGSYEKGYENNGYWSNKDSSPQDMHYDTKIWSIQVSGDGYRRVSYIDRKTRQFKGYLIDVINEVCQIAGKNCQLIHNSWKNCWNDALPGDGLLNKWYDACSLWGNSLDRQRSLKFSKPFTPTAKPVFLTLPGNPSNFNPDVLGGANIGFLGGWWSDRYCLLFSANDDLADDQIYNYDTGAELLEALNNREVDAIFVSNELPFAQDGSLHIAKELDACLQGGDSMMMRKDSLFKEWWDPALEKLLNSRTYRGICSDIDDPAVHGNLPGRDADDICLDY